MQNLKGGRREIRDVPKPLVRDGYVLIQNAFSLISSGTERSTIELAKKSLIGKAIDRPDQVRRVIEKLRDDGFWTTFQQVMTKLDQPMPLGYSSAGKVIACGEGVQGLKPGDFVASNGPHAEFVCVPKNLCARVPEGVSLELSAFSVLGAIALQGIRLSKLEIGSTAFVIGLGLIGQIVVSILKAGGIRVIGTDPDKKRCELALKMGAYIAEPSIGAKTVEEITSGLGADAVIITASTDSNEPIEVAVNAVRKKGRIVLIGVVGLNLDRRQFYFKECEFVVSCSYGAGRYDPIYEERGVDYPAPYVRWTVKRNMEAVLDLMARKQIDLSPLITHRFPFEKIEEAYEILLKNKEPHLAILLEYSQKEKPEEIIKNKELIKTTTFPSNGEFATNITIKKTISGKIKVGFLGAGNFATSVLIPLLRKCGKFEPYAIVSASGLSASCAAKKFGFKETLEDEETLLEKKDIDAIFICTRHKNHARQVIKSLQAGKHVFVEKPLALNIEDVASIEEAVKNSSGLILTVGYNRRFSHCARVLKSFFNDVYEPLSICIRMNAGSLPPEHWTQEPEEGGRIIGEACHAIDLATFIAGSNPVKVFAESAGSNSTLQITDDRCFITLSHKNGSISSIAYLAGGDKTFPKERIEVFGGGRVAVIEDFKKTIGIKNGRPTTLWSGLRDKGHEEELKAFADSIYKGNGNFPIPWETLKAVSLASILAVRSMKEGFLFEIPENL